MADEHAPLWVPHTYDELEAGLTSGMYESPRLDAKREMGSTKDICKDVAAMANEGGVLLYGIDEASDHRLEFGSPIDPHTAEERISNAVRTGIHNPPRIFPIVLMKPESRGGYLVLVVPQSPLAPHMVDIGGEGRFFGRRGTQTARLTGAQVDELHSRRRRSETDANQRLATSQFWITEPTGAYSISNDHSVAVGIANFAEESLTVLVAPTLPVNGLVDQARGDQLAEFYLRTLWTDRCGTCGTSWHEVLDEAVKGWRVGIDRYLAECRNPRDALGNVELEVRRDGTVVLRHAGVASNRRGDREMHERMLVNLTRRVLNCAGTLYQEGGYLGPVTVGVAVGGLRDVVGSSMVDARDSGRVALPIIPRILDPRLVRVMEITTMEIPADSLQVVERLYADLLDAVTGALGYPSGFHPLQEHEDFSPA